MKAVYDYFPEKIKKYIRDLDWDKVTEVRVRINKPLIINCTNGEIIKDKIIIDENIINWIFNMITNYSAYAYEESIKEGFLTLPEGHRVGFGGEVLVENDKIKNIRNISFLNIRISHFIKNCGVDLIKYILEGQDVSNTVIVSPPGLGKTTLLRDLVRLLSENLEGQSISVIDERNEISGSYRGVPSIDLGIRTDVISGCKKSDGIMMAVRSMGPNIIAVDEIGGKEDVDALQVALNSGVSILATMHGKSKEDILGKLGNCQLFDKYIIIKSKGEYICL